MRIFAPKKDSSLPGVRQACCNSWLRAPRTRGLPTVQLLPAIPNDIPCKMGSAAVWPARCLRATSARRKAFFTRLPANGFQVRLTPAVAAQQLASSCLPGASRYSGRSHACAEFQHVLDFPLRTMRTLPVKGKPEPYRIARARQSVQARVLGVSPCTHSFREQPAGRTKR